MHEISPVELARLADYVAGELSPSEVEKTEHWVAEDPDRRTLVAYLLHPRRVSNPEAVHGYPEHTDRMESIASALAQQIAPWQPAETPSHIAGIPEKRAFVNSMGAPRPFSRLWSRAVWPRIALGLTLCVIVILGGWEYTRSNTTSPNGQHTPVAMSTYTTSNGERATIVLTDGSTVLLNVASRLEVPADYDRGNRALRLTGEALFTVIHDQENPFTVTTGQHTTRVLGTSFSIRQYATDTTTTVAVRDGKVAVGPVVLTAGQETIVGPAGIPMIQTVHASRFSFAQGALILEDLTLPNAIPELNRWFDAEIRLGDAQLAARRVGGTFEAGSLTDLISIMELTFDVHVVREGRVLTLYPRN